MAVAQTEEKNDPSCILALDWLLSASILCQGRQLQLPQQLVPQILHGSGQHLLRNPGIVDKILNAADLKPSDTAFEIGPGTGWSTRKVGFRTVPVCHCSCA